MSYTGLVHWYACVLGTAEGPTPRRMHGATAGPPVARPHAPSAALEQLGDRGTTLSYGGLVGWYAAVVTATAPQGMIRATTPVTRPPLAPAA